MPACPAPMLSLTAPLDPTEVPEEDDRQSVRSSSGNSSQEVRTAQLKALREETRAAEMRAKLVEYESRWGLEGYVHDGELLAGPPYEPHPQRNEAFPRFGEQIMDAEEKAGMKPIFDEVLAAVANEPIVKLRELDIGAWQAKGGFTDGAIGLLLAEDERKSKKS